MSKELLEHAEFGKEFSITKVARTCGASERFVSPTHLLVELHQGGIVAFVDSQRMVPDQGERFEVQPGSTVHEIGKGILTIYSRPPLDFNEIVMV
jgi:hypothetical protein